MLGEKIGVRKETISKIERHAQGITAPQAHALAEIFNCRMDDLYEAAPGLAEEAAPFVPNARSFELRIPLDVHQKWYQIKKSYLGQIGYFDNVQVVIDISSEAIHNLDIGSVVIANKHSANGGAEIILRQFIPPSLLITNSQCNNLRTLNLETDDVTIFGIVILLRAQPLAVAGPPPDLARQRRAPRPNLP